ncbi:MAG TPA: phage tail protein [Acidimicrobiales bacterium]|nr:phage tail protein [Acidimicrobiales bacterium]
MPAANKPYLVDFKDVSTVGLESSPVADALAGLRANEARYFKTKYDADFVVEPASKAKKLVGYVARILKEERGIVIKAKPLEATELHVDGIRWTHVFYESGLAINVLYTLEDKGKRAVGFKLSEGMDPPEELSAFKWARQKSKLAGTIRGSYFVIKNEY